MDRRRPTENYELLIRLDEQVKSLTKKIDSLTDGLAKDVQILKSEKASKQDLIDFKLVVQNEMLEIKALLGDEKKLFIDKNEFQPIKNFVYGLIGMVLVAVLSAILALIFK